MNKLLGIKNFRCIELFQLHVPVLVFFIKNLWITWIFFDDPLSLFNFPWKNAFWECAFTFCRRFLVSVVCVNPRDLAFTWHQEVSPGRLSVFILCIDCLSFKLLEMLIIFSSYSYCFDFFLFSLCWISNWAAVSMIKYNWNVFRWNCFDEFIMWHHNCRLSSKRTNNDVTLFSLMVSIHVVLDNPLFSNNVTSSSFSWIELRIPQFTMLLGHLQFLENWSRDSSSR